MTRDQKIAHLALHGVGAFRHKTSGKSERSWRLAKMPLTTNAPLLTAVHGYMWIEGGGSLADSYSHHELSDIPGELLDLLDFPLIERFLSTTH